MKSPEDRGPRAAWAYETRVSLDISPEAVVLRLPVPRSGNPYDPATLRKAESHSRHMSGPLWRALTALYPVIAREKGTAITPPPVEPRPVGATLDQSDLSDAIRDQTKAIRDLIEAMKSQSEKQAGWNEGLAVLAARVAQVLEAR